MSKRVMGTTIAAVVAVLATPPAMALGFAAVSNTPVWVLPYGQVEPMSDGIPNTVLYQRCPAYANLDDAIFGSEMNWRVHWATLGKQHVIMSKAGLSQGLMSRIDAKFRWAEQEITLIRGAKKSATDTYTQTNNLGYGNKLNQYRGYRLNYYNAELTHEEDHVRSTSLSYALNAIRNAPEGTTVRGQNGSVYRITAWDRYLQSQALYNACPNSPYISANMPRPRYDYSAGTLSAGGQ